MKLTFSSRPCTEPSFKLILPPENDNLIAIGGSSNGRTADFGSAYLGSSPNPPADFLRLVRSTDL